MAVQKYFLWVKKHFCLQILIQHADVCPGTNSEEIPSGLKRLPEYQKAQTVVEKQLQRDLQASDGKQSVFTKYFRFLRNFETYRNMFHHWTGMNIVDQKLQDAVYHEAF